MSKRARAAVFDFHRIPHTLKPGPERAKSVKREAPILAAILQMLRLHPKVATVERRQVGAFMSGERYISVGRRGDPDITGILKGGRSYFIEVKAPGSYPDENQRQRIEELLAAGAVGGVARSIEEAKEIIDGS